MLWLLTQLYLTAIRIRQDECEVLLLRSNGLHYFSRRQFNHQDGLYNSRNHIRSQHESEVFCQQTSVTAWKKHRGHNLLPKHTLGPPLKGKYAHLIFASSGPSHRSGRKHNASSPYMSVRRCIW
ncbi:unnamed protein product [Cercospora beticola]|nr:unnamed protein product [Cercospora beticola]